MELDLAGLGITMATGAIAVAAVCLAVVKASPAGLLAQQGLPLTTNVSSTLWASVLALAVVFGIGMFVESTSRSIVQNLPPMAAKWSGAGWLFPPDRELRASVVISRTKGDGWEPTKTGERLAAEHFFKQSGMPEGADLELLISVGGALHGHEQISRRLESVFCTAKNHLQQIDNYSSELRAIEQRIAFARSCCFISTLFVAIVPFLPAWCAVTTCVSVWRKADGAAAPALKAVLNALALKYWAGLAGMLGIAVVVWLVSRSVYVAEQFNHNLRVYGYWSTVLSPEYRGTELRKP